MKFNVKLFAVARQLAGQETVELELPDGATVGDLRAELLSKIPALAPIASMLLLAVNQDYASDDLPLPDNAEVACIPPVSGG